MVYSYSEVEGGRTPDQSAELDPVPGNEPNGLLPHDESSGGTDHAKMDWILGRASAVPNNSSAASDRLADDTYEGLGRLVSRHSAGPTNDVALDYGYDRFGRLENLDAVSSSTLNDLVYGFNRDSQVLWREENVASAKDERYAYDDLARFDIFDRGDLNAGKTDITSPVRNQDWGLDLVGNWSTIATGGVTVTREHNRSNEITDVDTDPEIEDGDPTYDDNGNTTYTEHPAPSGRTFIYDAWNRLTEVKFGGTPMDAVLRRKIDSVRTRRRAAQCRRIGFTSFLTL